eukprot:scaffold1136_cov146-Cylindrotheca_fusiformis.AAC.13
MISHFLHNGVEENQKLDGVANLASSIVRKREVKVQGRTEALEDEGEKKKNARGKILTSLRQSNA